jgi:hypothetical protein
MKTMSEEPTLEADLKIGLLCKVETPLAFDDFLELITLNRVPSLRQIAYARVSLGRESDVSQEEATTREGAVYCPGRPALFSLNSPILYKAAHATNAHREDIEYRLKPSEVDALYQRAIQDTSEHPFQREVLIFPTEKNFCIEIDRVRQILPVAVRNNFLREGLSSSNLEECIEACKIYPTHDQLSSLDNSTLFALGLFKEMAIPYSLFIDGGRNPWVKKVDQDWVEEKGHPFARQIRFDTLPNSSCIVGEFHFLDKKEPRRFII